MTYAGICVGGPDDGKRLASQSPVFRIMISTTPHVLIADQRPRIGLLGEYHHSEGKWRWRPGSALAVVRT